MGKINGTIYTVIVITVAYILFLSVAVVTVAVSKSVLTYDSSTPAPSTRNNNDQYYFGYWQSCMLNNTLPNNNGERDRYCDAALDKAIEGKWGELDNLIWPVIYEDAQKRVWQK